VMDRYRGSAPVGMPHDVVASGNARHRAPGLF
jgi:hypothetical protein